MTPENLTKTIEGLARDGLLAPKRDGSGRIVRRRGRVVWVLTAEGRALMAAQENS